MMNIIKASFCENFTFLIALGHGSQLLLLPTADSRKITPDKWSLLLIFKLNQQDFKVSLESFASLEVFEVFETFDT